MRPGQMVHKVALEAPGGRDDGYGGTTTEWVLQFKRTADIIFLKGTEAVMASRLAGRQPVVVKMRADSETRRIRVDWRLIDQATLIAYAVKGCKETPDRMWIEITAESGVAQ